MLYLNVSKAAFKFAIVTRTCDWKREPWMRSGSPLRERARQKKLEQHLMEWIRQISISRAFSTYAGHSLQYSAKCIWALVCVFQWFRIKIDSVQQPCFHVLPFHLVFYVYERLLNVASGRGKYLPQA